MAGFVVGIAKHQSIAIRQAYWSKKNKSREIGKRTREE
jgi:hypothetical protein